MLIHSSDSRIYYIRRHDVSRMCRRPRLDQTGRLVIQSQLGTLIGITDVGKNFSRFCEKSRECGVCIHVASYIVWHKV